MLGMAAALNADPNLMKELSYSYQDTYELAFGLAAKLDSFVRVPYPPRTGISLRKVRQASNTPVSLLLCKPQYCGCRLQPRFKWRRARHSKQSAVWL